MMNPSLEEKERLERTHAQVSDRPSVDALEQDSREKGNLGANSEQQDDEFHVGDKHDAPMPGRGQEDTTLMDRFPKRRKLEEETAGISSHSLGQVVKADLHNQRSETAGPAMAPATNSLFLHRQSHQLGQLPSSLPNMNAIAEPSLQSPQTGSLMLPQHHQHQLQQALQQQQPQPWMDSVPSLSSSFQTDSASSQVLLRRQQQLSGLRGALEANINASMGLESAAGMHGSRLFPPALALLGQTGHGGNAGMHASHFGLAGTSFLPSASLVGGSSATNPGSLSALMDARMPQGYASAAAAATASFGTVGGDGTNFLGTSDFTTALGGLSNNSGHGSMHEVGLDADPTSALAASLGLSGASSNSSRQQLMRAGLMQQALGGSNLSAGTAQGSASSPDIVGNLLRAQQARMLGIPGLAGASLGPHDGTEVPSASFLGSFPGQSLATSSRLSGLAAGALPDVDSGAAPSSSMTPSGISHQALYARDSSPTDDEDDGADGNKPVTLYMACDDESLSEYQCLVRKQIELFEAREEDVESNAQGRNKPIVLRQVGIRCRHCSKIPPRHRTRGATYYPARLQGLYQAAQNMASAHLCNHCQLIPDSLRQKLIILRDRKSSAGGGKQYWADGVRVLGVIEAEDVLRFSPKAKEDKSNETQGDTAGSEESSKDQDNPDHEEGRSSSKGGRNLARAQEVEEL